MRVQRSLLAMGGPLMRAGGMSGLTDITQPPINAVSGTDVAGKVQDALDAMVTPGVLFLPRGNWGWSKEVYVEKPDVLILGDGMDSVINCTTPIHPFVVGLNRSFGGQVIDASFLTGQAPYGFRTRGTVWGQIQAHPAMLGGQSQLSGSTAMGCYYRECPQLTIDFMIAPEPGQPWGPAQPLFGMTAAANQYTSFPFGLWTGDDPQHLLLTFRTSDIGPSLMNTDHKVVLPLAGLTPPYSLKVQIDCTTGRVLFFRIVGASLVPVPVLVQESWAQQGPLKNKTLIENTVYPFMIGAQGPRGPFGGTTTPLILYGLRVTKGLSRDLNLWSPAPEPGTNTLMVLPPFSPQTLGRSFPVGTGSAQGFNAPGKGFWFHCNGIPPVSGVQFEGLTIQGYRNASIGICLGSVLHTTIRHCKITGGAQAVGCYNVGSSYPIKIEGLLGQGFDCMLYGFQAIIRGSGITSEGGGLDLFRFTASDVVLSGDNVQHASNNADTFIRLPCGDGGGSYKFTDFYVDNESHALADSFLHWDQHADAVNQLILDNINVTTFEHVPILNIQRMSPTNNPTWGPMSLSYRGVQGLRMTNFAEIHGGSGGLDVIPLDPSGSHTGFKKIDP